MHSEPTYLQVARDLWRAEHEGAPGIARRRARRLAMLVADARARSPFYRRHYAGLPADGWRLTDLPPTTKPALMAAFNEWVTDTSITRAGLEDFMADPARVGQPYRDGLFVCTTSGTTGFPGLFVHDRRFVALARAMTIVRVDLRWLDLRGWLALARRGLRWAVVVGTGAHFAGTGWVEFERHRNPVYARAFRTFSVQQPLAELVAALNRFDPAILTAYPSALSLLAEEQRAGRLRVRPTLIETAGESMDPGAREQAATTLGCPVQDVYGSTEFAMMAVDCRAGRLHVNSDWVILEPVDADMRPTPPGSASHTVLLTNLADRLQPIIRYDLGDTVVAIPDPCRCGSPFPVVQVQGRRDDVLRMPAPDGRPVVVLPLAISAAVESTPGVHRSQIVQTGPSALRLRLEAEQGSDRELVWDRAAANVRAYLEGLDLAGVELIRADEPPTQDPHSGKFRQVTAAPA